MFEGWTDMMRGMITAMVASAQVGHQQQREALEAEKAENEQRWKVEAIRNAETVEHEKSEIARVSAEAAAQTAALNKIGTALERIATVLEGESS